MRTKDEKLHERRRAEILAAATKCFTENGIRQTTMQEICARADISPGALYRYFRSKEDIIAAFAKSQSAANEEIISYLTSQKDIVKALQTAAPAIVKELSKPAIASMTLEIVSEAARNPQAAKPFLDGEANFKRQLIRLLEQGQGAGTVDKDVDVKAFVHIFVNLLDGLAGAYAFPIDVSRKRVSEALVSVIRQTLTPRGKRK